MVLLCAAAVKQWRNCEPAVGLTESSLSERRHSSGTASEPRKTRQASSGKPPSPDESATRTAEKERFDTFIINGFHKNIIWLVLL